MAYRDTQSWPPELTTQVTVHNDTGTEQHIAAFFSVHNEDSSFLKIGAVTELHLIADNEKKTIPILMPTTEDKTVSLEGLAITLTLYSLEHTDLFLNLDTPADSYSYVSGENPGYINFTYDRVINLSEIPTPGPASISSIA